MKSTFRGDREGYNSQQLPVNNNNNNNPQQHHHHHTVTGGVITNQPHHHHLHHSNQSQQQQQSTSSSSVTSNSHSNHHHHSRVQQQQPLTNTTGFNNNASSSLGGVTNNNYAGEFSSFNNNNNQGGGNYGSGLPLNYNQYSNNNEQSRMDLAQQQQLQQQQQQQQAQQIQLLQSNNNHVNNNSINNLSIPPVVPRVPLADRDIFMLSLPSQDLPHYYDPESSSDTESPSSLTTNRGHKLLPSSRHVRRGRLGSYPHTDLGFAPTSINKRQKTLSGTSLSYNHGFSIAPNFHLLKTEVGSAINATTSNELKLLATLPPPPQTPLDLLLSSSLQHTLGSKNQTFKILGMSTTGLIEQEGELIGSLQRVCSAVRGEGFEWRWPGDEERKVTRELERAEERKIEDERDRIEELERIAREEERMREEERIRIEDERNAEILLEQERKERERLEELERIENEKEAERIAEIDRIRIEKEELELAQMKALEKEQEEAKALELAATLAAEAELKAATNPDAMDVAVDGETSNSTVTAALPSNLPPLPSLLVTPSEGDSEIASGSTIAIDLNSLPTLPLLPSTTINDLDTEMTSADPSTSTSTDLLAVPESEATLASAAEAESLEALAAEDSPEEPTIRRRSGRVASRVPGETTSTTTTGGIGGGNGSDMIREGSTESSNSDGTTPALASGSGGGSGLNSTSSRKNVGSSNLASSSSLLPPSGSTSTTINRRKRIAEEEMPEYAKRLVDPEVYVRSLFVSETSIEMAVNPLNGPINGGNGIGAGGIGAGQVDLLSPNEQEVLVHDCLTDLHRFLADSLEYRSRLSEIRDGVLGVERRRKGLWKVVRMVAADWLEEESQAQENE